MEIDLTNLPTDTGALQALVRSLVGEVKASGPAQGGPGLRCAAWRRYAGSGLGSGAWQNQDRQAVGLCPCGRSHGSTAPPAAVFFYSPDRKGEHPQSHLKSFKGILHADGYAGFNAVFGTGLVTEAACWAHVRRKFFDVHAANGSPIANETLDRIGALYGIEAGIRGKPPDERQRFREQQSLPLLDDLKAWLETDLPKLSGKSDLAAAMRYALPAVGMP